MSGTQTQQQPATTTETPNSNEAWKEPFEKLNAGLTSLTDNVNRVLAGLNAPRQQEARQDPDEPDLDDAAMELLTRAQLAEYIANKTIKHMDKNVINPLRNQLREVTTQTTHAQLGAAVEAAKAKYPDFLDYQAEMVNLARTHSSLPPEDLYILAKSKNPKATKAPQGNSEGQKSSPKIKFGGLKPSTGGAGTGAANRKMAPADAATAAWEATVSALGGEPDFEE